MNPFSIFLLVMGYKFVTRWLMSELIPYMFRELECPKLLSVVTVQSGPALYWSAENLLLPRSHFSVPILCIFNLLRKVLNISL